MKLSIGEALDCPNQLHWVRGTSETALCGTHTRRAGLLPEWWRASFYGRTFAKPPTWCTQCEELVQPRKADPNEKRLNHIAQALRDLGGPKS